MGVLDSFGINQEMYNEIPAQKASSGSSALEPGVYEFAVDKAFFRKTDKGATMLEVDLMTKEGETVHYSTCIKSGDEKGNKTTYVKDGKEYPLPGLSEMKHFFEATGVPNPDGVEGEVKWGDGTITALCMTGLTGKVIKVGIRNEEDTYNNNVVIKNVFESFMTKDGKNGKGEDIEAEVTEKIAKNPMKKARKAKVQTAGSATSTPDAAAAAGAGW